MIISTVVFREGQAASWNISVLASSTSLALVGEMGRFCQSFVNSLLGLATVANMGAEVGATTSTFPYTSSMRAYLNATARAPVARAADEAAAKGFLSADEGAEYDEVIEVVSADTLKQIIGSDLLYVIGLVKP